MKFEIVVNNIESALRAQAGGADRIELCTNSAEGGTTPSYGVIEVVRQNVSLDVYVMIRPRGGDFLYSTYEFHAMKRDVTQCQRLSVDGIVFGILNADGTIDKKRCKELIDRARPLKVTCHRAFDMTRDPFEALEDCIDVGFDRILTSGLEKTAMEGVSLLRALQEKARDRIAIMAGAGVNETNVKELIRETQIKEIHFSAATTHNGKMTFINPHIDSMGIADESVYAIRVVDPAIIRKLRALVS